MSRRMAFLEATADDIEHSAKGKRAGREGVPCAVAFILAWVWRRGGKGHENLADTLTGSRVL